MSDLPYDRENFCYRHPDRQSFILCQRCGRTICTQCQTQAAVGVHCPDCVREARQNAPKRPPVNIRAARALRSSSDRPLVTYALIAICAVVYALQFFTGDLVTAYIALRPPLLDLLPWGPVTSLFAHGSILHLGLNMLSLFFLGRILEPALGRWRFLALFFIAGLGGSAAVTLLAFNGAALGASGSIFGMLAALVVIQRGIGGDVRQLLVILGINLAIGLFVSGISWQAHVGGIVGGALFGLVIVRNRAIRQQRTQAVLLAALALVFIAIIAIRFALSV